MIIFIFFVFLDPTFLDFQVPRFLNSQKSGLGQAWPELGRAWVREHQLPAAPRQPRRTNSRRSKELGQDRENPYAASSVWGKIKFSKLKSVLPKMSARSGLVRKKSSWPYLGPSEAIFPWTEKIKRKMCHFSLGGALAAIHPGWGNRYPHFSASPGRPAFAENGASPGFTRS